MNILEKWCQNQGSTVLRHTSRKIEIGDVCLRTKITKACCRTRTGEAQLRAQKFGGLITRQITKSSMRSVNPETITGTLSWYKILPFSGFNLNRAKHCTSKPRRSETNGVAERAVRVKEGTSAVLPKSGLDERWWSDSMECHCHL